MLVKTVIIITQRTIFAIQKSVKLVDVIRMLIGLTGIFANHINIQNGGIKVEYQSYKCW